MEINLSQAKKIYFVGIGGIGISAVARILKSQGKEVLGSDCVSSEITEQLISEGIKVLIPQSAENISSDIDLAICTVAVPEDNPERVRIKELGIKEITYPQLLGLLLEDKYGIGVSGTDGKTTTTAMVAKILIDAELDPTVVLGSKAEFLGGNSRLGDSKYLVFEADEYRRAFDNYHPRIAVITNVGADHLDYYHDSEDYLNAFRDYAGEVSEDGWVIYNNDNKRAGEAVENCKAQKISFGISSNSDYQAEIIESGEEGLQQFRVTEKGSEAEVISINLPGRYNIENALASIAVARTLGIDWEVIRKSLAGFIGTWRRFERMGQYQNTEVIADYAHTPDAVAKAISATKEFFSGKKKILTVFQPHQYGRTKNLFNDFVQAFNSADKAIIVDVFYVQGRENPDDFDVSSEKLAESARENGAEVIYGGDLKASEETIKEMAKDFDVVLVLGAGNVYEIAKSLVKK